MELNAVRRANVRGGLAPARHLALLLAALHVARGGHLAGTKAEAAVLDRAFSMTLPPSFWMWETTPPPPLPPGPNPQLIWVEQTAPPLPTTAPAWDACYGCDCLVALPGSFLAGGDIAARYTCSDSGPRVTVPEFKWLGTPKNTGQGHPILQSDGTECTRSQSFAITMDDLDAPDGVGEITNSVRNVFWAVNIPGDWTELNEELAHQTHREQPVVTIGRMPGAETAGLEKLCPSKGIHRVRVTLWALSTSLGSEESPVSQDASYQDDILPQLQSVELAKSTFFGTVKAKGYSPRAFLQRSTWFRD